MTTTKEEWAATPRDLQEAERLYAESNRLTAKEQGHFRNGWRMAMNAVAAKMYDASHIVACDEDQDRRRETPPA